MPYGTDAFTDRYGDYKQPTVVDYDQDAKKVNINPQNISPEFIEQHKKDVEDIFQEILSINPFHAGTRYIDFVVSINGKLAWNVEKIQEMKSNSDWLFTFRKYLNKSKNNFISNKNLKSL